MLMTEGCVSIGRTGLLIKELTDGAIDISDGTLVNWINELKSEFDEPIAQIKRNLAVSAVNHKDETGIRVDNGMQWLHVLSNEDNTYYHANTKRGSEADEAMGILPIYKNVLVHDHLKGLYRYGCEHVECNAHILRYLKAAHETQKRKWAKAMAELLTFAHRETKSHGKKEALSAERQAHYDNWYDTIIAQGEAEFRADPDPNRDYNGDDMKLLRRLKEYKAQHLLFLTRAEIPFDNNLAERDLRMIKAKTKISGCFRSLSGCQNFAAIKSVTSTLKKRGLNIFNALKSAFSGISNNLSLYASF
jgi:transposase-like protein